MIKEFDEDPILKAIGYASAYGLKDEIRSAAVTQFGTLRHVLNEVALDATEHLFPGADIPCYIISKRTMEQVIQAVNSLKNLRIQV